MRRCVLLLVSLVSFPLYSNLGYLFSCSFLAQPTLRRDHALVRLRHVSRLAATLLPDLPTRGPLISLITTVVGARGNFVELAAGEELKAVVCVYMCFFFFSGLW